MTDHRACLDVPTVSALIHIAINGPAHEEYDATRAVARCFTSGGGQSIWTRLREVQSRLTVYVIL